MLAANILQPNQIAYVETPTPEPAEHEVLIEVRASGICGTDVHILRGEYLGDYPVTPGHEFSGIVVAVGRAVTRFRPGDRVAVEPNIACDDCLNCLNNRQNFCLNWQGVGVTRPGGMAQCVVAPQKAVFDIGDLPFEHGAFMEPLSCVLHGVQRLQPELASRIAILGAGPIGVLLLQALRLQGAAHITIVDKNPHRADFAKRYGTDRILTDIHQLEPDYYDAVVDATGVLSVMSQTPEFARPGGKVLLFGVPPVDGRLSLDAFAIFRKGLTVLSSYTSVRNSYQALALLKSGRIAVADLISHRLPLEQLQEGIELIEKGLENVKKVMVMPNPASVEG